MCVVAISVLMTTAQPSLADSEIAISASMNGQRITERYYWSPANYAYHQTTISPSPYDERFATYSPLSYQYNAFAWEYRGVDPVALMEFNVRLQPNGWLSWEEYYWYFGDY
jgi:hypothetical protein